MPYQQQTVVLIDDNTDFTFALSNLLNSVKLKNICYTSAEEFLNNIKEHNSIGCIVSDIRMHGMSGLQLQNELKTQLNHTPIIFISGHATIPMSVQAILAGASNFLTKPINNQELLDCIFSILHNQNQQKGETLKHEQYNNKLSLLTEQEKNILNLIITGLPSKTIADKLKISKNTVDVHRTNILKKMQAKSVGALIATVVRYKTQAGMNQ